MSQCGYIDGMTFPDLPEETEQERLIRIKEIEIYDFYEFAVAVLADGEWVESKFYNNVLIERQKILDSREYASCWSDSDSLHLAQVDWLLNYMENLPK